MLAGDRETAPLVFAVPSHRELLRATVRPRTHALAARSTLARFENGELHARIESPVTGRVCAVLGSLAPPDEQLLAVLLLAHTLKREGARCVVAMLPYLGYGRQDRAEPRQSLGAAWVGDLLAAAGVDRVLTLDVHSRSCVECFPVPVDSFSTASLFAGVLMRTGGHEVSVVAPDEGALQRCEAVIRAAQIPTPVAYLRKRRGARGVTHSDLVGTIAPRVAIVDDILDTGGTLVSACAKLREAGAKRITVFATHALFTGERWRELHDLGVERIYTTDSIPAAPERGGAIVEVLPAVRMLVDALVLIAAGAHSGHGVGA